MGMGGIRRVLVERDRQAAKSGTPFPRTAGVGAGKGGIRMLGIVRGWALGTFARYLQKARKGEQSQRRVIQVLWLGEP